jgi:hypothetical protein
MTMTQKLASRIVTVILALLFLVACGGGGGGSDSTPASNSYIGFEASDFSGKTIYLVELNQWSKCVFNPNGTAQGYLPGQNYWYQEGTWTIVDGKLVLSTTANPTGKAIYTLLSDDVVNRYFRISQLRADGTVHIVGMFYDQTTAASQASEFVVNHRVP